MRPFHLEMVWDGGTLWVGDSGNGSDVRVDGTTLHDQWHAVTPGAVIEFGQAAMVVSSANANETSTEIPELVPKSPGSPPLESTLTNPITRSTHPVGQATSTGPASVVPQQPATQIVSITGSLPSAPLGQLPRPQAGTGRVERADSSSDIAPAVNMVLPDMRANVRPSTQPVSGPQPHETGNATSVEAANPTLESGPPSAMFALPPEPARKKKKTPPTAATKRRRLLLLLILILGTTALYLMTDPDSPPPSDPPLRSRPVAPSDEPEMPTVLAKLRAQHPEAELPTRLPVLIRAPRDDEEEEEEGSARPPGTPQRPPRDPSEPTLERDAADALAAGNNATAVEHYRELLEYDPENPAYQLILRILTRRTSNSRCIAGRREDGTLCTEVRRARNGDDR